MSKPVCYMAFIQAPSIDSPDHHDVALFSEDVGFSALIHKTLDPSSPHPYGSVNEKLQGRQVLMSTQGEIDALVESFRSSGETPAFGISVINTGWVADMRDDYQRIYEEFMAKQPDSRALTRARAMHEAHSKMIPM